MRCYAETTKDEFLAKVEKLMNDEDFPEQPARILKDLSKVQFDWENCTGFASRQGYANYPFAYKEIAPGFHIFFVNAGGDWEFPVCFIYYWSPAGLRAYIPRDGNAWNKMKKCAYGSDGIKGSGEADHDNEISEERMIAEILEHIKLKT